MRIECDKCHAKYSIADDKVRGKTFKIRCKKCANVIVVRDKAAAPDSMPADEPLGWHIALGGETVGPLTDQDIRRRYEGGEIDRDTSVWQEGFDDWVPLGSVEIFADLPVRAPVSEVATRDEVISVRASQSPRVTDLTGQRNENSVLFSLENLQKLAGGGTDAPAPAVSRFTPSTQAPSSEGSGLIDIRQMRTMMGSSDDAAPRRREDDALPSFSGGGFGGLSAQPLVTEEVAMPLASSGNVTDLGQTSRGGGRNIFAATIIAVAMVAVAVIYVNKPLPPPPPAAAPTMVAQVEVPVKKDKEVDSANDAPADEDSAAPADGQGDGAGKTQPRGATPRKPTAPRGGGSSKSDSKPATSSRSGKEEDDDPLKDIGKLTTGSDSSKSGDSKPSTSTGTTKNDKVEVDVDCILDPTLAKCKSGSSGSKDKPSSGSSTPSGTSKVDPNLPESLTPAAMKAGVEPIKSAAERCGQRNGAVAGSKVAIKFQVSGSTGAVTSADPLAENASTPVGRCVAGEAKKAKFAKFQKASQGFEFRFKM